MAVLGDVRISAMDSSLTYMQVTDTMEARIQQEIKAQGPEYMTEEDFEDVHVDPKRGLVNAAGESVVPGDGAGEEYTEVPISRPQRTAHGRHKPARYALHAAKTAYTSFVTVMFMAGMALTSRAIDGCPPYTQADVDESMYDMEPEQYVANNAVSHAEYHRRNPK